MTTAASTTFDLETLRRGHADHDAAALADLYAPDATITIIDRSSPPTSPTVLEGQEAIRAYYDDVCSRPMTHEVEDAFATPDRLAFRVACQYDTGERVLTSETCELEDGRIVRETLVQAWDE